ncbi:6881_t:CDS:2 [Funneliformis caledonium]|uniref:6881_t:CDS:1 n=1 Tax=Funneliformis caledonium TaxID=1117310 RepID=A0A9N9AXM5_9GLOM|nr:6881_t:CDS:2 [Funneliformis caledonium]
MEEDHIQSGQKGSDEEPGEPIDEENRFTSSSEEESTDSEAAKEIADGEDELDLIEENTGVKIARSEQKFKRLKRGVRNPSKDVKNIFDEDEEEVLEENEEDFVVYDDGEDFVQGERHAPTLFEEVFNDLEEKYVFAYEKIEEPPDFNIETLEKVFSPEAYLTRKDKEIKTTDLPERFQLRQDIIVNRKLTREEINLATDNVTKSISGYHGIRASSHLYKAVKNVLSCFGQEFVEVPYIWTYKKDLIANYDDDPISTVLSRADLWYIFDLEYDFRIFLEKRDQINSEISKNHSQNSYICKIFSEVKEIDELYDLNVYIKFQERKGTISVQRVSPTEELRRKGMVSKNVKYLEYIHKGLLRVVDKFGVQIPSFVQSLISETKLHQPVNENLIPLDIIRQFYPEARDPEELLRQSTELLAYEISLDPMFRKFVRNSYMRNGLLITSGPLKDVPSNNECWSYCFWNIPIQKAFNIGAEFARILYHSNQKLINLTFQLRDEEKFLETLKNNIVSDNPRRFDLETSLASNSHVQWNKYRIDAVHKAYNDILRPNIESWIIAKLKVNAEQCIMEQCMLNLERKIDVKPFRASDMRRSAIPRVFALSFGAGGRDNDTCCVYINEYGKKIHEWFWPMLKDLNSNEGNEFLNALEEHNPHIIVVRCYDFKTKFLLQTVKTFVRYHNERINNSSEKVTVTVIDDKVAIEYTASEIAKKEYPKSVELSRYCTSLARMVQNPLMEHLRLGDKIMSIKFHPLQSFLPEEKLKEALDRAFINVVNEVGVDINDILHDEFNEPKQRALHYICGFGPRKSIYLKQLIFGENYKPQFEPFIDSRSMLKDILSEPKVFQNCAGFLRIRPDPNDPLDDSRMESLDDSRIHPDYYDLARKYSRNTPDMNDAISNHRYFLMQLIKRENRNPFGDRRRDYELPTVDQVFEMVTKETKDSLYQGLIVPVVVRSVTTGALRVRLRNSGFECNIGWNYIDKNNNIEEGDTFDALVKSINKEDFTIILSCKPRDLDTGNHRSFRNEKFEEFIDREAKENYQPPVKVKKINQYVSKPKPKPPRHISHSCFERVSASEAEEKLSTQPNGFYIIRPKTDNPDKLSITWKIYDNVFRHFDIIEIGLEPGQEVGRRLFVEGEQKEYEALEELLVTYIDDTNDFIDKLISHQKFKPTERQLDEYLDICLRNNPKYTAYGFYMDNANPGCFFYGYKFRPGAHMSKMRGIFRPYGYRVEEFRFHSLDEVVNGMKQKILERYTNRKR